MKSHKGSEGRRQIIDKRQDTGYSEQETRTGDKIMETGDKIMETGDKVMETGDWRQDNGDWRRTCISVKTMGVAKDLGWGRLQSRSPNPVTPVKGGGNDESTSL
jgi:hypothetical protein